MPKIFLMLGLFFSVACISNAQSWATKAANAYNPYDSIGYKHNEAIIYCKDNYSTGTAIERCISTFTTLYPDVINTDTINHIANASSYAALNDSTNYAPESMPLGVVSYTGQLISVIDGIQESGEIDDAIAGVRSIENDILSNDVLSSAQKQVLLSASSVARYSMYYWLENVDSSGEDGLAINNSFRLENPSDINEFGSNQYFFRMKGLLEESNGLILSTNFNFYKKGWLRRLLHIVVGDLVGALVGAVITLAITDGIDPVLMELGALLGAFCGSIAVGNLESS